MEHKALLRPEGLGFGALMKPNMVFLGEAGCGKSEIALNLAVRLSGGERSVHLFDVDQTKPIYRSRDAREVLDAHGVALHHETHDFDSPTIVGGVAEKLLDINCHALIDVGGGEAGARMIGRFAHLLNREDTAVYYVVNAYRPWSRELLNIDETLSAILRASRIRRIHLLANPNLGIGTTAEEFLLGLEKTREMLAGAAPIEAAFAREELYTAVKAAAGTPVLPLRLCFKYDWIDQAEE